MRQCAATGDVKGNPGPGAGLNGAHVSLQAGSLRCSRLGGTAACRVAGLYIVPTRLQAGRQPLCEV